MTVLTFAQILIPGCGSSELGAELYQLGYLNITNIDSSEAVIEQLSERYDPTTASLPWEIAI
jgi:hypothetical protein